MPGKRWVFWWGANSIGMAPLMTLSPSLTSRFWVAVPQISGSQATHCVSKGLKNKCRHRSGGVCRSDVSARASRLSEGLFTPPLSPKTPSILLLSQGAAIPQTDTRSRFDEDWHLTNLSPCERVTTMAIQLLNYRGWSVGNYRSWQVGR